MAKLKSIVSAYIREYQAGAQQERDWFANQPSLTEAVRLAAFAQNCRGKRLSHQYRIPRLVLQRCEKTLLDHIHEIRSCKDFDQLHQTIIRLLRGIRGAGELYYYDTAERIAARLGIAPKRVYLHAGTRIGARNIGLKGSRVAIELAELPHEFLILEPREIEDLLCLYKDQLAGAPLRERNGCTPKGSRSNCRSLAVKRRNSIC